MRCNFTRDYVTFTQYVLTDCVTVRSVRVGDHVTATVSVTDWIGDELEEHETLRHAYAVMAKASCDWPELRRAILERGGIGPSRDWTSDAWPGDLYRVHGLAPDLVATTPILSDVAPWADAENRASDTDMQRYLQRAYGDWQRAQTAERDRVAAKRQARKPTTAAPARGTRRYADLVAELQRKHGADVDLSGLRSEYVNAYETGERITVERDGRTYRGTVGATRGPRPRFVLLLSLDL